MESIGRAWLYARKSSYRGKQKGRGRSVAEQLAAGRGWCEENETPVAGQYVDDGSSASRLGGDVREDYERMIADIESGKIKARDIVVAWEASRLNRDLAVYVQLRDACWKGDVLWCINGRVYDLSRREDRKASAHDAIQAEDEVYQLSERVRRSLRANAAAGRPQARSLWGYRRVFDADTGDLVEVVIDEEPAKVVREMFERVANLESLRSIRADLNARGIASPTGKTWDQTRQITVLLTNASYIGKRVHLGKVIGDAIWPPILALPDGSPDEDLFYKVQAILSDPSRRKQRDTAVRHLLSGIAVCGKCGDGDVRAAVRKSRGYRQYHCAACFGVCCKADPIDDYVTALVIARLARPDAAQLYPAEDTGDEVETKKALGEIARWREELAEGERLVEAGELTMARLARMEQRLLPRIEEAESRLRVVRVDPLVADMVRPSVEEVAVEWKARDVAQRRAVLRRMIERLELVSVGSGRSDVHPRDRVRVEWRRAEGVPGADRNGSSKRP